MGACSSSAPDSDSSGEAWTAVRDTVGDTIVVRTVSGSVGASHHTLQQELAIGQDDGPDEYLLGNITALAVGSQGEIYAHDRQVPIIRKCDQFGTFVRNVGREGEGPGEYRTVSAMRVLPDGRLVIGGRGRVSLYSEAGEFATSWNVAGALFGRPGIPVSPSGPSVYVLQRDMNAPREEQTIKNIERTLHYVQYDLDGTPRDAIEPPDTGFELAMLISSGSRESGLMPITTRLPFTPEEWKILTPSGDFIVATADRYALNIQGDRGLFRVERARELASHELPFMIIGGHAVLLHGRPRLTEDLEANNGRQTMVVFSRRFGGR